MSNHVVAVNIVRQPSPFAPQDARTSTKSFVRLEGSVADLRKALLDDQVIQPGDKFYGFNGQPISNNSELHTTWTDALQGILVVGAEDTPAPAEPVVHRPCVHQMHAPVASAQLHIHAPTVKAIKVPQLIFNSGESDVSETKTLTEACVTPVNKPSCVCPLHLSS
ncbi:hypothetical protein BDY19DRAFT_440675 [Irpex rosettiformis]|uniref:Uncharacterized protein n=1 Tax=Irpex rosettiformis TaxID=378272 RepID=A0ACB8TU58_9APHY|nr:hypothetical protein BDY19DRAFT_440675 [Irpex rosettiformis]